MDIQESRPEDQASIRSSSEEGLFSMLESYGYPAGYVALDDSEKCANMSICSAAAQSVFSDSEEESTESLSLNDRDIRLWLDDSFKVVDTYSFEGSISGVEVENSKSNHFPRMTMSCTIHSIKKMLLIITIDPQSDFEETKFFRDYLLSFGLSKNPLFLNRFQVEDVTIINKLIGLNKADNKLPKEFLDKVRF